MTPVPTRGGQPFVAYVRVSTKRQDQKHRGPDMSGGYSPETQREAIRAYVKAVSGTLIEPEYVERESAYRTRQARPQLVAALNAARAAGAVLVIAKLDRLARNVHFLSGLLESGVEFVALDLPGANTFTLHIMAAVAEQESRRISERVKAGMQTARAKGARFGGVRPQMLKAQPWHQGGDRKRELAVAYYRQHHIDALIRSWRDQSLGYHRIAKRLMAEGVRTSTGAPLWTGHQVRTVHLMMERERAKKVGAA